jgi:phosphate transport system protein
MYGIKTFTNSIDDIQEQILEMGKMVQNELSIAVELLVYPENKQTNQVQQIDQQVDQYDNDIHSAVLQLITIHPPLPEELKALTTMMRISRELERIGDQAVNIAEISQSRVLQSKTESLSMLDQMKELVISMLEESMTVFAEKNLEQAKVVAQKDDEVNRCFLDVQKLIVQEMQADPDQIEVLSQLILVNRYLERSADHVVNITRKVKSTIY